MLDATLRAVKAKAFGAGIAEQHNLVFVVNLLVVKVAAFRRIQRTVPYILIGGAATIIGIVEIEDVVVSTVRQLTCHQVVSLLRTDDRLAVTSSIFLQAVAVGT